MSVAVKLLATGAGQCQSFCPFAIKSGGHTPWGGANNVEGGMTLDLSELDETTISSDRTYIRLGGGVIWHDAYLKTNGTGVAFPGGRCPGTGVGGKSCATHTL